MNLILAILERLWPPLRTRRLHLEVAYAHYQALETLLTTEDQKQRLKLLFAELNAAVAWPPYAR
jgi:hypothetical protein